MRVIISPAKKMNVDTDTLFLKYGDIRGGFNKGSLKLTADKVRDSLWRPDMSVEFNRLHGGMGDSLGVFCLRGGLTASLKPQAKKTGMPRRFASRTAMFSFIASITKSAEGRRLRSAIEPRFFSNFARWREIWRISLFDKLENVPSLVNLSIVAIFLTALRIVGKLVSIPPGQRSTT